MTNTYRWLSNYELLKKYYEEHGNIDVPSSYEVNGIKLGSWLHTQRCCYNGTLKSKISEERVKLLEELGMKWDVRVDMWYKNYCLLKSYYEKYGNIDVPINYEVDGVKLRFWLNAQRSAYFGRKSYVLTDERIGLLNALGMKWSVREENWDNNYYLLEEYYKKHGNIDVPKDYLVNGVNLGSWLRTQRQAYNGKGKVKITEDKILLLNDLGMDWSTRDTKTLNNVITDNNIEKYNKILLKRLKHILEDLANEGFNEINSSEMQKEIEDVVVKRLWR